MLRIDITEGQTVDGFRIVKRLHRGGMATIWRVERDDIAFPIVMKIPFLDYEGDLPMLVGFEVEQMIMSESSGPHVPRFVANGDFSTLPYIVMEYIEGGRSLQSMLVDARPLPIEEVITVATRLAEAVADLHHQRVLHLDLKPANVLFRPSGAAVLIDFGLSRHEELPDLLEEQYHSATGTPEYMAPEQLYNVRSDRRSDVYAIGGIIYQMLTGRSPFGIPSRIKEVRKRLWRNPVPPLALRPETPPWLQEIVLRCLEPNPANRYASATDLRFDLTHPELVEQTDRGRCPAERGARATLKRWWRAGRTRKEILAAATAPPPKAPIVVVALDLRPRFEALRHDMLEATVGVLANLPGARIACVNVMLTSLIAIDENVDAEGHNVHVKRLAELRRWLEPLSLPRGQATFHLLEAMNVAPAILDFARSNKAAHIVIGIPKDARIGPGTVSDWLQREALCPVTAVRAATS